jgi:hypothetical protein
VPAQESPARLRPVQNVREIEYHDASHYGVRRREGGMGVDTEPASVDTTNGPMSDNTRVDPYASVHDMAATKTPDGAMNLAKYDVVPDAGAKTHVCAGLG